VQVPWVAARNARKRILIFASCFEPGHEGPFAVEMESDDDPHASLRAADGDAAAVASAVPPSPGVAGFSEDDGVGVSAA